MRSLAVLMALLAALSGCSDPEAEPDVDVDGEDVEPGSEDNTTIPEEPRAVDLTATLTASATNGSAPLNVTFEVGATGTIDPVWAVDFGDGSAPINGSVMPTTADHTFTAAGNFSVVLTVTDGDVVAYAYANVTVTGAGAMLLPIQALEFSHDVGSASCADPVDPMVFGTPANGVLWSEWAIDPATIGQTYVVSYSGPNTVFRIGFMAFYGADDHLISFLFEDGGDILGTVPEGAAYGVFSDCITGPVSGTYTTTGMLPVA